VHKISKGAGVWVRVGVFVSHKHQTPQPPCRKPCLVPCTLKGLFEGGCNTVLPPGPRMHSICMNSTLQTNLFVAVGWSARDGLQFTP
jgi:hypothetical protein